MTPDHIALLFAVGLFGGAWNAVAGGASLFTFPALMAAGLPPVVANATNYLALLPANAAALPAYRRELAGVGAAIWPLMIISGLGAVVGALLLLVADPMVFAALIPWLILFATGLFAFGDALRKRLTALAGVKGGGRIARAALFMLSIYGGFFGAGLGVVLLAIAQIMGFTSFHVANSLKNLLATSFTILSIIVFSIGGLIAWPEGAAMMAGATVGGYCGGRLARRANEPVLRAVVIVYGVATTALYFAQGA